MMKKHKREDIDLTSMQNEIKVKRDQAIAETNHLLGTDKTDPRPMNMFLSAAIELPILCKRTLQTEELIKLTQRASNFTFCWNNASNPENPTAETYLDMKYLDMN